MFGYQRNMFSAPDLSVPDEDVDDGLGGDVPEDIPDPVFRRPRESAPKEIRVRSHQDECVEAILGNLAFFQSTAVDVTVGGGKTVIMGDTVRRWPAGDGDVLCIAHRDELITQNINMIRRMNPGLRVDREQGSSYASAIPSFLGGARVVVGSIQSIAADDRLKRFPADRFGLIMFDEGHRAVRKNITYKTVIDHFPKAYRLGLTGTMDRADNESLSPVFESLAYRYTMLAGMDDGFLVRPVQKSIRVKSLDISKLKANSKDLNKGELEKILTDEKVMQGICHPTYEMANDGGKKRRTIIFTVGVDQAELGMSILNRRDPGCAEFVSGKMTKTERRRIIDRFKAGEFQFLLNCMVLTEGFDCPEIQVVAIARPTKSRALYCLDDNTEALTPTGWVNGGKLKEGDLVAGFDHKTGSIKWEPVLAYICRDVYPEETMVAATGPSVDVRMTDTHRMVYSTGKEDNQWSIARAGELIGMHSFRLPACGREASTGLPLTDDEIRFIGLVMTDGTFHKTTGAILISQNEGKTFDFIKAVLDGCGFKYGLYQAPSETNYGKRNAAHYRFSISRGKPRGTKKHLRGWGDLADYIPKVDESAWELLEAMDERQFDIFAESLHVGDGRKQPVGVDWTQRTYHIAFKRTTWADKIQSIAVRRGWRCSYTTNANGPESRIGILHMKKTGFVTVGGGGDSERTCFKETIQVVGEKVWCISVESGAFVSRRNGKVVVVGNTQMVGRGLRTLTGLVDDLPTAAERLAAIASSKKPSCLVLDFVGNAGRHQLVAPVDLFAGEFSPDAIARARKQLQSKEGLGDTLKAIRKAHEEIQQEREARRQGVVMNATYEVEEVDPFKEIGVKKPWNDPPHFRGQRPTEKQIEYLERRGVGNTKSLTKWQAKKLIDQCLERQKYGLSTYKQITLLKRFGYDAHNMSFDAAKLLIDRIRQNRWRPIPGILSDGRPAECPSPVS
jgi:superfamily II DNA or RNA helicase